MKSRTVVGVVPALGFSLLPTLTCPARLLALASALGAVGLTFIAELRYLIWLNLAAFLTALLLLARNERRWVSMRLGATAAGALAANSFGSILGYGGLGWAFSHWLRSGAA